MMRTLEPISIPEDFWFESRLLKILSRRDIGALFREITTQFAASQMRIGVAVGMEQNQVCRIMKGDVQVRHLDVFERIAGGLRMPPHARLHLGLAPGETPENPLDQVIVSDPGIEPARPAPPTASPRQQEILVMTIRRARHFALLTGHYLIADAVDYLHEDTRNLAIAYQQTPLPTILGDIADAQDTIFTLLEHHRQPDEARELYFLAGVIGGMLTKASHDLGRSHSAMTHARTAFLCADQAGHDGLRAWIRGLQSLVTYWGKRPHDSLRYAQDGSAFAQRSHNTAEVWLAVNEARAWAMIGNASEAGAAIDRAEHAREQTRPDELDDLSGICTFGRSRQLYYAADALTRLPVPPAEAETYSELAIAAYADTTAVDWSFSDQAGSAADLAIARVARGELDGAAEAITTVLDLPIPQRIHGIVESLQRVHGSLRTAPNSDAKHDLQQQIEAFSRTTLTTIPG